MSSAQLTASIRRIQNTFLETLYREIHLSLAAYLESLIQNEDSADSTSAVEVTDAEYEQDYPQMLSLIRTARVTHAFDAMSTDIIRSSFRSTLSAYQIADEGTSSSSDPTLVDALAAFRTEAAHYIGRDTVSVRLSAVMKRVNSVVTCLCLHSETFRAALTRDSFAAAIRVGGSRKRKRTTNTTSAALAPGPPIQPPSTWSVLLDAITASAASIELFGRVRGFDGSRAMTHHDWIVNSMIADVFTAPYLLRRPGTSVLPSSTAAPAPAPRSGPGIWRSTPYFEDWAASWIPLHNIPYDEMCSHVWALSDVPGEPAQMKLLTWEQPVEDDDDPTRDTATNIDTEMRDLPSPTTNPYGELVYIHHEPQLNITTSFLPSDYTWPHRAEWPIDDPRYCTILSQSCRVCGRQPGSLTQNRLIYPIAARDFLAVTSCSCSFRDLQEARNKGGWKGHPRVELYTAVLGTGVRSLQGISAGEFLGEYLGEMYPEDKDGLEDGAVSSDVIPGVGGSGSEDGMGSNSSDDDEEENTPETEPPSTPTPTSPIDDNDNDTPIPRRYPGAMGGMYVYQQFIQPRPPPPPSRFHASEYRSIAIDSARYGNCTRYINHSCAANTRFLEAGVGGRMLLCVQATRPIRFGEQITVNYGTGYFVGNLDCRCGSERCVLWDASGLEVGTVVDVGGSGREGVNCLGRARREGRAPAWDVGNVVVGESVSGSGSSSSTGDTIRIGTPSPSRTRTVAKKRKQQQPERQEQTST